MYVHVVKEGETIRFWLGYYIKDSYKRDIWYKNWFKVAPNPLPTGNVLVKFGQN